MHLGVGRIRVLDRFALVLAGRRFLGFVLLLVFLARQFAGDLGALVAGGIGVGAVDVVGTFLGIARPVRLAGARRQLRVLALAGALRGFGLGRQAGVQGGMSVAGGASR